MSLQLPRVGPYEIVDRISGGGMSEVLLAERLDGDHCERFAVKRLLPQYSLDLTFVKMFLDEGRIATTLVHPNIVRAYEVGQSPEGYYLAMELLDGLDVGTIMNALCAKRERMPIEVALTIVTKLCAALDYAHEKVGLDGRALDIVHRDIKPSNVLVTYEGEVKLLDFGIATASNRLNRTRNGEVKGTVPYMSPEQCIGSTLDRRSDVFSVGIVLWELLTCRRLFAGGSDFDVVRRITIDPIPAPSEADPSIPAELDNILAKALSRDAAARQQTTRELQQSIDHFAKAAKLHLSSVETGALAYRARRPRDFGDQDCTQTKPGESLYPLVDDTEEITEVGQAPIDDQGEDGEPSIVIARSTWRWSEWRLPARHLLAIAAVTSLFVLTSLGAVLGGASLAGRAYLPAAARSVSPPIATPAPSGTPSLSAKAPRIVVRRIAGPKRIFSLESDVPASAWIDGVKVGRTPARVSLSDGPHRFHFFVGSVPKKKPAATGMRLLAAR